jgi:hypothetical protein
VTAVIVAFDTVVAFVIHFLAMLMPSPVTWHKEHHWNPLYSEL